MQLKKVAQQVVKVALVLSVLATPFILMVHFAKNQTEVERSNRLARIYTPPSGVSADGVGVRKPTARKSVSEALESVYEPTFGCWKVSPLHAPKKGLQAVWFSTCPTTPLTTRKSGEYRYPKEPFYLSAWGAGTPKLIWARAEAVLTEDLSNTEDTSAGMLFLPATKDGNGYYVAAWEHVPAEKGAKPRRGIQIGRYGNPPTSVGTSGGRVYLDKPWDWEVSASASENEQATANQAESEK